MADVEIPAPEHAEGVTLMADVPSTHVKDHLHLTSEGSCAISDIDSSYSAV